MLNLSKNSIDGKINLGLYQSFSMVREYRSGRIFARLLLVFFFLFILLLFLPWTQNIRSRGYITTLQPEQRPQTVHSVIGGQIEKWYVREGNFVNKGDTIVFLSEIKDQYFDPNLLPRTESQIKAKGQSVDSYRSKAQSLEQQIAALRETRQMKMEQARNYIRQAGLKVTSDSIDFEAAKINFDISQQQLVRMEQLYKDGLKSLTDLEKRRMKLQETQAKVIGAESKYLSSQNGLINARVELTSIDNQYKDKLSKAESDKFTALSNMYDAEGAVTKMENQLSNYSVRTGMYYITAPQAGYITKAIRSGLGETVKAGEELVSIMPAIYDLAVEMYVYPMDLPLLEKGQSVRFMFDGWPSVVFSGWPGLSYGTFGGKVVAIDNFISANGKYRLLVAPDPKEEAWPEGLRVGSGANGVALLKDVPIWYELWRQLNGFPADYYEDDVSPGSEIKNKKESKEKK